MANKLIIFSLLTALLGSTVAQAEEKAAEPARWFQVELIFFEPIESSANGEIWPRSEKSATIATNLTELAPPLQPIVVKDNPAIKPRAFQLLNPSSFALSDISEQLLKSRKYRVLSHIAWRQPTVELAESRAVHVHDELMQEQELIPADNKPLLLNNLPDPIEQDKQEKRFNGTITVSLSRYLHLKADINYYNPEVYLADQIAQQANDEPNIEYFRLSESRRMRSKEVHYIDHPYFGIIALITPYEVK